MKHLARLSSGAAVAAVIAAVVALPAAGKDIITEWSSAKAPPAPELKPVTVDPKTTALFVLDFMKTNCGVRPRCAAIVPNVKRLLDGARATDMMVFYSLVTANATPENIVDPAIAPRPGEALPAGGPDKFLTTDLDKRLKDRGIKSVIVTGTSAQGAVVGSGNALAQRGYQVIVPVDGMSSEDDYDEQYAAWYLYKGGPAVVTSKVTLTRSTMVKFGS
jgi:nicotinamidase-related amidase